MQKIFKSLFLGLSLLTTCVFAQTPPNTKITNFNDESLKYSFNFEIKKNGKTFLAKNMIIQSDSKENNSDLGYVILAAEPKKIGNETIKVGFDLTLKVFTMRGQRAAGLVLYYYDPFDILSPVIIKDNSKIDPPEFFTKTIIGADKQPIAYNVAVMQKNYNLDKDINSIIPISRFIITNPSEVALIEINSVFTPVK